MAQNTPHDSRHSNIPLSSLVPSAPVLPTDANWLSVRTSFHLTDDIIAAHNQGDQENNMLTPLIIAEEIPEVEARTMSAARIPVDLCDEEAAESAWKKQLCSISTLLCILQVLLLTAMIYQDGFAPYSDNELFGPPITTLVRYGAKFAALIVNRNQWWRLFTSVMLHAGIIHIACNAFIQLKVGGYLNVIYGNTRFCWIYLISGVYGQMCSCLFLPADVGVGSSGALMGLLSSWMVWILFRWNKVPPRYHGERNIQLFVVVVSILLTLATSTTSSVDWAAHAGGAIQGLLWGFAVLGNQLHRSWKRSIMRWTAIILSVAMIFITVIYMIYYLHPPTHDLEIFDQNDDWSR